MTPTPPPAAFARRLLRWYDRHGRKSLPWRAGRDPYRVWVAEIMLQQTQVATVIPYYRAFIARFPDVRALASCDADELLHYWSGLGYYARARNLHAAARHIVARHGGRFPDKFEHTLALPGIGRTTAGAILVFAYHQRHPILDGNVKRVLARHRAVDGAPAAAETQARLWRIAEQLTPAKRVADYTQAMMDLGALVCVRATPQCAACPVAGDCRAYQSGAPTAFPQRKPKAQAARRRKAVTMLLVQNPQSELLLVKRPPSGIWGGLWSPPEHAHAPAAQLEEWCARQFGLRVKVSKPLPPLTHSFTHFDLDILPLPATCVGDAGQIMDGAPTLWYNPSTPPPIGLPAAVNRILEFLQ